MTLVVDSSVVVAAFVYNNNEGVWAEQVLALDDVVAPHFMPVEVAHALRRLAHLGRITDDLATRAHRDMLSAPVQLHSYEPFADRVWELRRTVTAYDAWYVAIAEWLQAPLATIDRRLTRASGPRCRFLVPPA